MKTVKPRLSVGFLGRERWQKDVEAACSGFRLDCVSLKHSQRVEIELIRAGLAELLTLRISALCLPIFGSLTRLENSYATLAALGLRDFGAG